MGKKTISQTTGLTRKTLGCFSEREGLAENRSAADSELQEVFYKTAANNASWIKPKE